MKYLAVLGRQPEISIAELEALFGEVRQISENLATWTGGGSEGAPAELQARWGGAEPTGPVQSIDRLGGTLKIAQKIDGNLIVFLKSLPDGKITFGVSDYSVKASRKSAQLEALKLKKILVRHGRSVRAVESKNAVLSTATSLHNGLGGQNPRKVELIKTDGGWYRVIGVQDIDAYARRDQARPARDAKVGMLPPKLAQILINLCGPLSPGARILDPFCGTGVVLQEALLMGYAAYGTDLSERMVEYSEKNLEWLLKSEKYFPGDHKLGRTALSVSEGKYFQISQGDATRHEWTEKIDAVACEGYLGQPMSEIPTEMKLKEQKQECGSIVLGFLKNLGTQIAKDTPVVIAVPAWLRQNGTYERLEILDEIEKLGYNVSNKSREGLVYCRVGQIVARDIIILRKT